MDALKTILSKYALYLWVAVALIAIVAGIMFVIHERDVGKQAVVAADALARAEEHAKIIAETDRLQRVADKAEGERDAVQRQLDDYIAAHPIGVVRLCPSNLPARVSSAPGVDLRDEGTRSVTDTVPAVSTGSDIGPELTALMREAGSLAALYRQYQQQPEVTTNANP